MQLSSRDAARLLGVDEGTLQRWARRGEIAARLVHDQYRFNRVDLLELAAARGLQVAPELLRESEGPALSSARLADAVRAGGVHRDVQGHDKESVLRAVVERLPVPERVDREFLRQMLLAREQLGSTGFGRGIAIPHARNPIVLRVEEPLVAVAYLAQAVDFAAVDGRPVHTLFTVVTPSVRVHLHLLAVLGASLRDPAVQAAVAARAEVGPLAEAIARVEEGLAPRGEAP